MFIVLHRITYNYEIIIKVSTYNTNLLKNSLVCLRFIVKLIALIFKLIENLTKVKKNMI